MFINDKYRFVFIAVPRTGSSHIHRILKTYCGMNEDDPAPEDHHMSLSKVIQEYPNSKDYQSVAFVRNPYDRLLSAYCNFTQQRKTQYSHKLPALQKPLLSEFTNFEDFCEKFASSEWNQDVHFRPQYTFLEVGGEVSINHLCRFENFERCWNETLASLGLPSHWSLSSHEGRTEHSHYSSHYTSKTKQLISSFFEKDLRLFNYDFETK